MGLEATTLITIATVASTMASVGSAIYASQAAGAAQDYNAALAEAQGRQAQLAAEQEAKDRERRARYLLGQQLAATGASGVDTAGSPLLAMVDAGVQEDVEARRILYKGYLAASGARSDAALARYEADSTRTAGYINAGTSLLRGASNTYATYKRGY